MIKLNKLFAIFFILVIGKYAIIDAKGCCFLSSTEGTPVLFKGTAEDEQNCKEIGNGLKMKYRGFVEISDYSPDIRNCEDLCSNTIPFVRTSVGQAAPASAIED